jgi:hypothetical protein
MTVEESELWDNGREEMATYREAEKDEIRKIWNDTRNFEKKLAGERHNNSRPFSPI